MYESKQWFLSKGVWGPIITVLSLALGAFFGINIDANTQAITVDNIVALLTAGATLVGAVIGLIGRVKASKVIK